MSATHLLHRRSVEARCRTPDDAERWLLELDRAIESVSFEAELEYLVGALLCVYECMLSSGDPDQRVSVMVRLSEHVSSKNALWTPQLVGRLDRLIVGADEPTRIGLCQIVFEIIVEPPIDWSNPTEFHAVDWFFGLHENPATRWAIYETYAGDVVRMRSDLQQYLAQFEQRVLSAMAM